MVPGDDKLELCINTSQHIQSFFGCREAATLGQVATMQNDISLWERVSREFGGLAILKFEIMRVRYNEESSRDGNGRCSDARRYV